MITIDIFMLALQASNSLGEYLAEYALANDSGNMIEAAIYWGQVIEAAKSIVALDQPMRVLLVQKAEERKK